MSTLLVRGIKKLITMRTAAQKAGRRVSQEDLSVLTDAAMIAKDGVLTFVGSNANLPKAPIDDEVDLGGRVVMPAFVECHTHLAFAGSRTQEFEWRQQGVSYQEIAARGGGIVSTVNSTRSVSDAELARLMQKRVDRFVSQGVSTLEVKSGYGLDFQSEAKLLRLAGELKGPRVVRTFLGAHAKPKEARSIDAYFRDVLTWLPEIARQGLTERVDIFVERGFFTSEQAQELFTEARRLGLGVTVHAEQLSHSGGASAALDANAASVDHVVEISTGEITRLASSETVAVLLPCSDFYLRMKYPPARALIDAGACVALSTDFNPGTSPTQDLSLVGVLARIEMKMTLTEVLSAWTVGAAKALSKLDQLGSLEIGKQCDFVVLEEDEQNLFYSVGEAGVHSTWRAGLQIFEKKF